ncbi:hypothetical protein BGX38DRAFT_1257232 [Terfezia claveryi]|nr:hypothetical protein BGX38DRAFT_1257232 [Terfezia claveryi]
MPVSQEIEEREQRLQEALGAYRSGLPEYNSIRKAAAAHGVSQSTLGDRVRGYSCSKEEASVQKQKLTEAEEDVLSQYLDTIGLHGSSTDIRSYGANYQLELTEYGQLLLIWTF